MKIAAMRFRLSILLVASLFLWSCTSDSNTENDPNPELNKITLLYSNTDDNLFQYDVLNDGSDQVFTNLTQELGVYNNFQLLDCDNDRISFFSLGVNNSSGMTRFAVYEKRLSNGAITIQDQICDLDASEEWIIPARSDSKFVLFTRDNGFGNSHSIRILDRSTNECVKKYLFQGSLGISQRSRLVDGETVYVVYETPGLTYAIMSIDLATAEINNQLEFNQFFSATVDENNLHIFLDDNTHMIYNKGTFELLSTGSFPENLINVNLSYGLFESQIVDGNIYTDLSVALPAPYPFSPGALNLDSGEIVKGGNNLILDLIASLEAELGFTISINGYSANLSDESVVIHWRNADGSTMGLLYSNFEGDILKIVETDSFIPFKMIIR